MSHPDPRTNWAGNVAFGATRILRPESLDTLRHIVGGSRRVRPLGRGHSFSGIVDGADDSSALGWTAEDAEIDSTNSTVRVHSLA